MAIKDLIRKSRIEQGLTLDQLSEKSGLPRTTLHNYELGVQPTVEKADQLLKALGLSMVLGKNPQNP